MFAEKFRQLTHKRPLILGHRGSPRLARENSLASFNLALEEGADGIELDVHVTADGVLVAHHDEYLETHEIIAQTNYADLKRAQQAVGSDLPTLAEVFRLVAGRGVLNIELKNPGYEPAAIALARELLPVDTFAFSSFDPRAVLACRHSAPDVPAFWIVWGPRNAGDDVKILEGLDASGIALENRFVTDAMAEHYRARHIPVFVWTVNDLAEAARFARLGVIGLITDLPRELVAALA